MVLSSVADQGSMFALMSALVLATVAPAESPTNTLEWTAPSNCPTAVDVRGSVEVLLGGGFEETRFEPVAAQGSVQRDAENVWVLSLGIRTASGQRERSIVGTSCQELADVAAVLLAIAIDPSLRITSLTRPEDPTDQVELPEPPKPSVEREVSTPPAAPRKPITSAKVRGTIQAFAVGGGGALPSFSPGVGGSLGASWKHVRFDVRSTYWFARSAEREGSRMSVRMWALQPRVCGLPRLGIVQFPVCTGLDVGAMVGIGENLVSARTKRAAWLAVVAASEVLVLPWRRVGFVVGAECIIPLIRSGFSAEGVGVIHRAGPVAGQGRVAIELRFP